MLTTELKSISGKLVVSVQVLPPSILYLVANSILLYLSETTNLLALSPEKEKVKISALFVALFEFSKKLAIVLVMPDCLTSVSLATLASSNAFVLIKSNKGN